MIKVASYSSLVFIVLSFLGCQLKKSNNNCGEVSIRILYSLSDEKYEQLEQILFNREDSVSLQLLGQLNTIKGEMIVAMGGFKQGKSLEIQNPCASGEKMLALFEGHHVLKSNHAFISQITGQKIVSALVGENLQFIYDSYFTRPGAIFDKNLLANESLGHLTVEYLVYQLAIFDLIIMQSMSL